MCVVASPVNVCALKLAQLVQDGLHHAQRLVVCVAAPPDLVHTQRLKEGVDGQQQAAQVNRLKAGGGGMGGDGSRGDSKLNDSTTKDNIGICGRARHEKHEQGGWVYV